MNENRAVIVLEFDLRDQGIHEVAHDIRGYFDAHPDVPRPPVIHAAIQGVADNVMAAFEDGA